MNDNIYFILIMCLPAIGIAMIATMILLGILSSHLYNQLEDISNSLAKILRLAEEAAEEDNYE